MGHPERRTAPRNLHGRGEAGAPADGGASAPPAAARCQRLAPCSAAAAPSPDPAAAPGTGRAAPAAIAATAAWSPDWPSEARGQIPGRAAPGDQMKRKARRYGKRSCQNDVRTRLGRDQIQVP
eukprot:scaffold5125_cov134-Isochrysis_galbana.AAC.9